MSHSETKNENESYKESYKERKRQGRGRAREVKLKDEGKDQSFYYLQRLQVFLSVNLNK